MTEPLGRHEAGRRLKAAREARGLTQSAAATMLGVQQSHVSRWERGVAVFLWTDLAWYVATLGLDWSIVLPESQP